MPRRAEDEPPLDELNEPHTAQVMLGDNPTFRANQRELVESVKERIHDLGDPEMIARLPELDRALEAYMADPAWVGGPGHLQLMKALRPLLRSLGIDPGNFGLI